MKIFLIFTFSILISAVPSLSQDTTQTILLSDIRVQIEATEAVNDMYNFKFASAEKEFRWLRHKYSDHPLPYFLLGLSQWWKMVPNIDLFSHDVAFLAYMDSAIYMARNRYDDNPEDVEAGFFLAAAYGFKGRLYAERKSWGKAAIAGKNALKYLEVSKGKNYLSPEFLFGDGLFNYFSVWIPENYGWLKPILSLFPKGDKELGIEQLREVANNAFYTRTEAQYFLMSIMSNYENKPFEALQIAEYLANTFPGNPYFKRFYARLLYTTHQFDKAEKISLEIISNIDNRVYGYEQISGRYAGFFLGQIYDSRNQKDSSKYYYDKVIKFSEQIGAYESGYYLHSLFYLAKISYEQDDKKAAKSYYKKLKKHAKSKHPARKRAKEYFAGKSFKQV